MASLSEKLNARIEQGERLATEFPDLPPLFAVPLPNGPGGDAVPLPSLRGKPTMLVRFEPNGAITGVRGTLEQTMWTGCGVTQIPSAADRWFGLVAVSEGSHSARLRAWKAWATFAAELASDLSSHPESPHIPSGTSGFAAVVFQTAFGTPRVSEREGCFVIKQLWPATLFTLRMLMVGTRPSASELPQSPDEASSSQPPEPQKVSLANLAGLKVKDAVQVLADDPKTADWSAQDFATAIGCSKAAVVQSPAWKERQADRDAAKALKEKIYRSNAERLDHGHNRSEE